MSILLKMHTRPNVNLMSALLYLLITCDSRICLHCGCTGDRWLECRELLPPTHPPYQTGRTLIHMYIITLQIRLHKGQKVFRTVGVSRPSVYPYIRILCSSSRHNQLPTNPVHCPTAIVVLYNIDHGSRTISSGWSFSACYNDSLLLLAILDCSISLK